VSDAIRTRVVLAVRGMDTDDARELVREAVAAVPGVLAVETEGPQQFAVEYDAGETTVMEMIRAARRLGFLAGMA
jgi:copper chaperone